MIRLGYHFHYPIQQKNDGLYTISHLGRFIDSLASQCESLVLFFHPPSSNEMSILDYRLTFKNIQWINIGDRRSFPYRLFNSSKYTDYLKQYYRLIDAFLMRGPSPLTPAFAREAMKSKVPVAFLIGGDYLQGVNDLPQPFWRKSLIKVWATWYQFQQMNVLRNNLVFVNSPKLFSEYKTITKKINQIQTTTLNENDFYERQDTCQSRPIRLLYTGRMSRTKGILDVMDAINILINRGEDVVFDLVGMAEKGDTVLDELGKKASEYGISDRVKYHGYRPVGSELFAFYKRADIYVIASQSSFEGFPRTIWEAMAHSLPVVATRVGGIPGFIEGKAELIEPRSVDALVGAIQRLIHDVQLRQKYIQTGFALAKENTLAKQAQTIIGLIEKRIQST